MEKMERGVAVRAPQTFGEKDCGVIVRDGVFNIVVPNLDGNEPTPDIVLFLTACFDMLEEKPDIAQALINMMKLKITSFTEDRKHTH